MTTNIKSQAASVIPKRIAVRLVWGCKKDEPQYLEDLLSDKCMTDDEIEAVKLAAEKYGYVNFRTSKVFI